MKLLLALILVLAVPGTLPAEALKFVQGKRDKKLYFTAEVSLNDFAPERNPMPIHIDQVSDALFGIISPQASYTITDKGGQKGTLSIIAPYEPVNTMDVPFELTFDISDKNATAHQFTAKGMLRVIDPLAKTAVTGAPSKMAVIEFSDLETTADGKPKAVGVTTNPPGLDVQVTYNGAALLPSTPGAYAVVATVTSAGYLGTKTATLTIDPAPSSLPGVALTVLLVVFFLWVGTALYRRRNKTPTVSRRAAEIYADSDLVMKNRVMIPRFQPPPVQPPPIQLRPVQPQPPPVATKPAPVLSLDQLQRALDDLAGVLESHTFRLAYLGKPQELERLFLSEKSGLHGDGKTASAISTIAGLLTQLRKESDSVRATSLYNTKTLQDEVRRLNDKIAAAFTLEGAQKSDDSIFKGLTGRIDRLEGQAALAAKQARDAEALAQSALAAASAYPKPKPAIRPRPVPGPSAPIEPVPSPANPPHPAPKVIVPSAWIEAVNRIQPGAQEAGSPDQYVLRLKAVQSNLTDSKPGVPVDLVHLSYSSEGIELHLTHTQDSGEIRCLRCGAVQPWQLAVCMGQPGDTDIKAFLAPGSILPVNFPGGYKALIENYRSSPFRMGKVESPASLALQEGTPYYAVTARLRWSE